MSGLDAASATRPGLRRAATSHSNARRRPVELTLDALHGRFRPLIVWNLFWGTRPFSELMRTTERITKKALRWELAEMESVGLVRREVRVGRNRKADYSLTPLGESLKPIVAAMYETSRAQPHPRPATSFPSLNLKRRSS